MDSFRFGKTLKHEHPPIGFILSGNKEASLMEYVAFDINSKFVLEKYQIYLRDHDALIPKIKRTQAEVGQ